MPADFTLMYGSVAEADSYFENCLHRDDWFIQKAADKEKAIKCATQLVERLSYVGYKAALYNRLKTSCCGLKSPSKEDRIAADSEQPLKFPRNCDTEVPCEVLSAVYEIAYSLLVECRDPDLELEALGIKSDQYDVIRTVYDRDSGRTPPHLLNGIPSARAWACLSPWLTNVSSLRIHHTS